MSMEDLRHPNDVMLSIRDHLDPDKHWIGEALAPPTQGDLAATIGNVSGPGDSPFVARADHMHKVDPAFVNLVSFNASPGTDTVAGTTTSFTDWLTSNTFTVPDWCVSAMIHVDLTNIYIATATGTTYTITATISTGTYSGGDACGFTPNAVSSRQSTSFSITISGFTPGTGRSVKIGARRASGTGDMHADSSSKITGFVNFRLS